MPTLSISAGLLILGNNTEGLPWNCTTWQALTKIVGPPWEAPTDAPPQSPAPNYKSWSIAVAHSVKAYAQNLWSKTPAGRIEYASKGYTDNDSAGRDAWNNFVRNGIRTWKLNQIVDNVFKDCKLTAYDAITRAKSKVVSANNGQIVSS